MTTKNLVPRLDGEGKLGIKGATNLNWKEINAVSGSFSLSQTDLLQNQAGNDLIVAGTGITVTHSQGASGSQYTLDVTSQGTIDSITEGQAKVETIDTGTDARIEFWADPDDDGTSTKIWEFNENGHLLPSTNSTFDIGSAEQKVRHLYLSDASLRFGSSSTNTSPYHLSVDTLSDTFRVSTDNGASFETLALLSDMPSLSGYATETYVNDTLLGLDAKEAVDAATVSELSGYTYSNNIFTEDSPTGALTIDNVTLVNNDRILVKDQGSSNEVQHGIYVVTNVDGSSAVTLTRSADLNHDDTDSNDFDGVFVFALGGDTNEGKSFIAKPILAGSSTVGTHGMTWVTFTSSAASSITPTLINVNTNLEADKEYVIDPSITNTLTLNLPASTVADGAQIKITNLSTQKINIQLNDNTGLSKLYYADGTLAPTVAVYRDEITVESQGTIRLYQAGSGSPAEWYLYHSPSFEVEVANSSLSSADTLAYSSQRKAFMNAGEIHGDYILTGNISSDVKPFHKYVTTFNETVARTVSLPDRYNNEDIIQDLDGKRIYFENRGTSTLTIDLYDNYVYINSIYYRAYLWSFNDTNIASIALKPGESVQVEVIIDDVSGTDKRVYYKLGQYTSTHEVIEDTSGVDATISHGREKHLVYIVNTTSNVTITLPTLSDCKADYQVTVKNAGTGTVTLNRGSSNTFDGLTTATLTQYDYITLIKRSSSLWSIISEESPASSDDLIGNYTASNYAGTNLDTITTHLSGIDATLGNTISSVTPTLMSTYSLSSYTILPSNAPNLHIYARGNGTFTLNLPSINSVINSATTDGNIGETFEIWVARARDGDVVLNSTDGMDLMQGGESYQSTLTLRSGQWIKICGWRYANSGARYVVTTPEQPLSAALKSIADLTTSADKMIYTTAADTYAVSTLTSAGRALLDDADASAQRTTLGLGTASTLNVGTSANNVVQLDAQSKLPAIDGSQLINLPAQSFSAALNDLTDVTLTTPTANSVLTYDDVNSIWIDGQSLQLTGNITTSGNVAGTELRLGSNDKLYQLQYASNTGTDFDTSQVSTTLKSSRPFVLHSNSDDMITIIGRGSHEGGSGSSIRLYDAGESSNGGLGRNYIKIKVPEKLSSSYTLTLPSDDGTANQVLETDGNGGLSWVSPSSSGGSAPAVTSASPSSNYTISTSTGIEEVFLLNPTTNIVASLPSAATVGAGYKYNIKNLSTNSITVKAVTSPSQEYIDVTLGTYAMTIQYSSLTLVSDGSNWFII